MARLSGHAKVRTVEALPPVSAMTLEMLQAEIDELVRLDRSDARRWACEVPDCDGEPHEGWLHKHARAAQRIPWWFWTEWLITAGRGWGKTRTAAEAIREWAKTPGLQIAVLAKNETLVREICFESPKSGLLSVIPPEDVRRYVKGSGPGGLQLHLKNGTIIFGFSAEIPDNLRGWAFDKAWCDEYAAWTRKTAQDTYDMLWFCLREAPQPQVILSTTPKALPHVRKLVEKGNRQAEETSTPELVLTKGHTRENTALSEVALTKIEDEYGGTRLGRQELGGELLQDVEGALWQQWMFETEGFRVDPADVPPLDRIVVSVDPAVKSKESADQTAFTVMGRSYSFDVTYADGLPRGYVLHAEQDRYTPEKAMRRAAQLAHQWKADVVVIEANNGGEYLPTVLRMVDPTVQHKIVHATRDKRSRATPVATLYERARMHHVGKVATFSELEEQMLTYIGVGEKDEDSPDLLDSAVWAAHDLFLDPTTPRVSSQTVRDRRHRGR